MRVRWARNTPKLHVGTYGPWYLRRSLVLRPEEAAQHMHILGVSGSGKSRFLAHWYLTLLRAGFGACFIDPHGDAVRLILAHLTKEGFFTHPGNRDRLLYLDLPRASRNGRYLPFNLLSQDLHPATIASNVKEAMHRAFPELAQGAAIFDTLLPRSVRVLIHHNLPLTNLERFLLDGPFRRRLLDNFPDLAIVRFFRDLLERLRPGDQLNYIGSVLRRAQLLTDVPILRHSLGQRENALPFRKLLDSGKSALINLAVPEQEAGRLLGCLLTVSVEQAALSRSDLPSNRRGRPYFLFLDEFTSYCAQSEQALSAMLSQTRKMNLFAVLGNQTFSQTSERLRGALGNAGIRVAFKLSRDDGEEASRLFGRVDTEAIKHEVTDEDALERTHPMYYSLPDQWERVTQGLTEQRRQQAHIRLPSDRVYRVTTAPLLDIAERDVRLDVLEAQFEREFFKPALDEDETVVEATRPVGHRREVPGISEPL